MRNNTKTMVFSAAFLALDRLLTGMCGEGENTGDCQKRDLEHNQNSQQLLIAIDGPCASGKTTLGQIISELYDCNVFHMDDFFLRPEQRTRERMAETGGNVDYERFRQEVLDHIADPGGLTYQVYDCGIQKLAQTVYAPRKRINVVEGSYSQHPYFGDCYDLRIFLQVEKKQQLERIRKRNGEEMLSRFREEWIPKEWAYFNRYGIAEKSLCLNPVGSSGQQD